MTSLSLDYADPSIDPLLLKNVSMHVFVSTYLETFLQEKYFPNKIAPCNSLENYTNENFSAGKHCYIKYTGN